MTCVACVTTMFATQAFARSSQPPWLRDGFDASLLQISLVTIDPGQDMMSWWGHSALLVEDVRTRIARVYNLGAFSSRGVPSLRLLLGDLEFNANEAGWKTALHFEKGARRITRRELLLTPQQRVHLADELDATIQGDGSPYLYNAFADNCAVRARNAIDAATGGMLSRRATQYPAPTLRSEALRRIADHSLAAMLLAIAPIAGIDNETTLWDTMFVPAQLAHLLGETAEHAGGLSPVSLAGPEVSVLDYPARSFAREPPSMTVRVTAMASCAGIVALLLAWLAVRRNSSTGRVLFVLEEGALGLLVGVPCLLLSVAPAFQVPGATRSAGSYAVLVNAILTIALPLAVTRAAGCRRIATISTWIYASLGAVSGTAFLAARMMPNSAAWLPGSLLLPLHASLTVASWMLGARATRPG